MKQNVYFVSGIDTDAGKSYATAFIAREWNRAGRRTITQKFIQTGNVGHSEDIDLHRRIMGIPFTEERSEEHTSELQSRQYLVCRLLLEKTTKITSTYTQHGSAE